MKVLIVIKRSPPHRYLVTLPTEAIIRRIKDLINRSRYSQAMAEALTNGQFEREVLHDEFSALEADLILTESTANWDLT